VTHIFNIEPVSFISERKKERTNWNHFISC
jgi:hypothetical protein